MYQYAPERSSEDNGVRRQNSARNAPRMQSRSPKSSQRPNRTRIPDLQVNGTKAFNLEDYERQQEFYAKNYALQRREQRSSGRPSRSHSTGATSATKDAFQSELQTLRAGLANDRPLSSPTETTRSPPPGESVTKKGESTAPNVLDPLSTGIDMINLHVQNGQGAASASNGSALLGDQDRQLADLYLFCVDELQRSYNYCVSRAADQSAYDHEAWQTLSTLLDEQKFRLVQWANEAKVSAIQPSMRNDEAIRTASMVFRRLGVRTKRLAVLLREGLTFSETQQDPYTQADIDGNVSEDEWDDVDSDDDDDDDWKEKSQITLLRQPVESFLERVNMETQGLNIQLQTLRRLTRSVRDAQNSAQTVALRGLVEEVDKYFGTEEACAKYQSGTDIPGDAALKMAREKL